MIPILKAISVVGFVAGAVVGAGMVLKKMASSQSDLMTGAIHFRNGFHEIGKAFSTIFCGPETEVDEATRAKERESRRIIIE